MGLSSYRRSSFYLLPSFVFVCRLSTLKLLDQFVRMYVFPGFPGVVTRGISFPLD